MTQLLKRQSSSSVEATTRPAPTEINRGGKSRRGDEIFGRLVAVRRAGLGLSQEDLAARMNTSRSNVVRIEKGRPPSAGTLKRLTSALDVEPGTRPLWNSLGPRWLWEGLAIAAVVIVGLRISNTDGDSSRQLPQAVSAAPAAPVAAGGAQGTSRKAKKRETKKPEKKSATPAAAVSEPSLARAPTTSKRRPATIQPTSEPVASSPAPSTTGGSGGSNDPPPQPPRPPQVEHGSGGGEASHGIVPGGG
jgi:transcriptional regulator with XRE-family HTH domain